MAITENVSLVQGRNLGAAETFSASLPAGSTKHRAYLAISNVSGATVGGTVQTSINGVDDWTTVATFSNLSSAGIDVQSIAENVDMYASIRVNVTVSGGTADVDCRVYFEPGLR
jgi:hypothetical protein